MNAKKLSRLALLAAVAIVLLFIAGFAPTAQLGLTAVAGITTALAVIHTGLGGGVMCWVAASAVALILLPAKNCAVMYALFFGVYPVLKSLIERIGTLWTEWVIKLICFNVALSVCLFALKELFFAGVSDFAKLIPLFYIGGNVVFVIYDIGFSRLISFYYQRFKPKGI